MTSVELAWICGIFEGEGCSYQRTASTRIVIQISMTDRDIIERVHRIAGVGRIDKRGLPSGKTAYVWSIRRCDEAADFLRKMLPLLGERRTEKALRLLEAWDSGVKPRRMWTHCSHGHPLSGANLHIAKDARRRCRTCIATRMRRYRAALREKKLIKR